MPTCKHKPVASIPLRSGKKTLKIYKLFPFSCWDSNAAPDHFRVMDGEKWVDGSYTIHGVANLMREALREAQVIQVDKWSRSEPPSMPKGSRVRVPNGRVISGQRMYDWTFTLAEPVRGYDGHWVVPVSMYGQGVVYVPVDELGDTHG